MNDRKLVGPLHTHERKTSWLPLLDLKELSLRDVNKDEK